MRCICCNKILNDKESTRKYASTGSFLDMCDNCFITVEEEIPTVNGQVQPNDYNDFDDFFDESSHDNSF